MYARVSEMYIVCLYVYKFQRNTFCVLSKATRVRTVDLLEQNYHRLTCRCCSRRYTLFMCVL